jgi:biotin transport system substrate-specific component
MNRSQALVPSWIESKDQKVLLNILAIFAGSALLTLLAQIKIILPFTPVPITGQTFGVAFLALSWGSRRAMSSFAVYLLEGFIGLPVFAAVTSSATLGYLAGMLIACGVVGTLADRGYAKSVGSAFLCCVVGSICIFSCGLLGLSLYLPAGMLLKAGLLPFLFGDFIKNILAASLAMTLKRVSA